jgi:hypothetical protein
MRQALRLLGKFCRLASESQPQCCGGAAAMAEQGAGAYSKDATRSAPRRHA